MAEAEDVIVDAARHATAYAQDLLRRHRPRDEAQPLRLLDVAARLDLLLLAVHGRAWPLRPAQPPPPPTALRRLFKRDHRPWRREPAPSTDGVSIWLPPRLDAALPPAQALLLYRAMTLQQAQRAAWRKAHAPPGLRTPAERAAYLVLEGEAADAALVQALPGLREALQALRADALRRRPALSQFAPARRAFEEWVRERLDSPLDTLAPMPARAVAEAACDWAEHLAPAANADPLFKDAWTGDWPPHEFASARAHDEGAPDLEDDDTPVRSARLSRRPTVRPEQEGEDDDTQPGAWMIQTAQPHEHAEDPIGQQRPADRDTEQAAESHAESLAELPEARLVRSARAAHEVLLSDEPPPTAGARAPLPSTVASGDAQGHRYPEWDYRTQSYRDPGVTVWDSPAEPGPAAWVERTLDAQRGMLTAIRRRFEMLRAQRLQLHRQVEGDEIDIEACIEARADLRAGAAMSERLYRRTHLARRDTAVLVLVDVSGSTDAWVAGQRRIIDVEREALLPLSIALDSTGDPHAIVAFSGQGPQQVRVRTVKRFDEPHGDEVARRIAGLEPEHYTRTGAALRHASHLLRRQPARHRLLLLLSDGKPNDVDDYEGRYGVEDMRQAVLEARHAGLSPFCLTVDRQASSYLPRIFGPHHYALLQQPDRLPTVLLDWMKRLLLA